MTPRVAVVAVGVAAVAGLLRGFTGFGFALAAVPGLSLVLAPVDVVPCVLLLQVVAGVQLVPKTRHAVDWRALRPILVGAILATPFGTAILARLPEAPMRAAIGAILLAGVVVLARGTVAARKPSLATRFAIGFSSGLLNGGTAMAGPPVIAYFLATSSVEVSRASLLMYFLLLSVAGTAAAIAAGLMGARTLGLAVLLLPALVVGNEFGHRWFGLASPETYRRIALVVLAAMAVAALARAFGG